MFEAVPRLAIAPVAPQQSRQLFARVGRPRRQGKDGQQGPVLLARQIANVAVRRPYLKTSKKPYLDDRRLAP